MAPEAPNDLRVAVEAALQAIKSRDISTAREFLDPDVLEWWASAGFARLTSIEATEVADGADQGRARVAIYAEDGTVDASWSRWERTDEGWHCTAMLTDEEAASDEASAESGD